tara:strand:+ start:2356 stop:3348 length:993 start_codon:yes stop_codon:yes gene_type:complete
MSEAERIYKYQPLMKSLYETAKEKLGFVPDVSIVVMKNDDNAKNPLGKTAHYSPSEHKIALYTQGRHIKDILRSLAHELVHHKQNCRGDFDNGAATVAGYAQEDGHLREMEREAYECGNMIFRDWEDNLKNKGAKPLFTSTHYTPPMTTSVVGGRMVEGEKMKNQITESRLREIIKGVIQEMFNDDLTEAAIDDPKADAAMETAEAGEEKAQAAAASATGTNPDQTVDMGLATEAKEEIEEAKEEIEESKEEVVEAKEELEEDKEEVNEEKEEVVEAKEEVNEEKEELEEENDAAEEVNESYFPQNHDIRSKARNELNEALMKRWMKIIK